VTYDFDRSHENIEDRYWAAAQEKGYQLRFDAHQILDVIFIYVQSREGFSPIAKSEAEDIRFFASAAEVEAHCTGVEFAHYLRRAARRPSAYATLGEN